MGIEKMLEMWKDMTILLELQKAKRICMTIFPLSVPKNRLLLSDEKEQGCSEIVKCCNNPIMK